MVGLYAVTPDWHPIVGPAPLHPGLWLAVGGSGHSFKIGPGLGQMLAERIETGACSWTDARAFGLERFDAGAGSGLFESSYGGNRA